MGKLKNISIIFVSLIGGYALGGITKKSKAIDNCETDLQRLYYYYDIQSQWISNLQNGITMEDIFLKMGVNKIAIYGKGKIGVALYRELKNSKINVKYFIDSLVEEKQYVENDLYVIPFEEMKHQESVDMVIITPIQDREHIEKKITKYCGDINVMGINEVVYFSQSDC